MPDPKKRHQTVVPLPVVIVVLSALASFYLFLPPHKGYVQLKDYMRHRAYSKRMAENRKKRQELRKLRENEAQEHLERLKTSVRGYIDDARVDSAFFEYALVDRSVWYWRYENGMSLHGRCYRGRSVSPANSYPGFTMTEEEKELLLDVLNIIAQYGLATPDNESELNTSGGGRIFRFSFGPCNGQFSLPFDNPPYLEKFFFKIAELRNLTSESHPSSICPPGVYKSLRQILHPAVPHTIVPRPTIPVEVEDIPTGDM